MLHPRMGTRRNDRCICGSGKKYKYCCSPSRTAQPIVRQEKAHYIDTGESPVRYVIVDGVGTSFFSTKDNKIIVFKQRADAVVIATLEDFTGAEPGEINVAGVGATKWQHLQNTLPFVEVESAEEALVFVRERMEHLRALMADESSESPAEELPSQGDDECS